MVHDMHVRLCVMGVGHVTQCDAGHVRDETLGVGPGLSGCRDGFGTEHGMSHNNVPSWQSFTMPLQQAVDDHVPSTMSASMDVMPIITAQQSSEPMKIDGSTTDKERKVDTLGKTCHQT